MGRYNDAVFLFLLNGSSALTLMVG